LYATLVCGGSGILNIGEQIKYSLKIAGLTQRWLANEMKINEKTLSGKLNSDSITADELLTVARLLDMDLNKMKRGENIMFNWLKGINFCYEREGKLYDCEVIDIDSQNRLVANVEESDDKDFTDKSLVVDVFDSHINFQFNYFENWEDKLFNKLITQNKLTFYTLSTESGDDYALEIFRTETNIGSPKDYSNLTIVTYVMTSYGEIKETPLVINKTEESKEIFAKWMKKISESTDLFNDHDSGYVVLDAITFEISQITDEEFRILYDLFNNK